LSGRSVSFAGATGLIAEFAVNSADGEASAKDAVSVESYVPTLTETLPELNVVEFATVSIVTLSTSPELISSVFVELALATRYPGLLAVLLAVYWVLAGVSEPKTNPLLRSVTCTEAPAIWKPVPWSSTAGSAVVPLPAAALAVTSKLS
jgi:hypothetical protein